MAEWTPEQQKEICERIGYDFSEWDSEDPTQSRKLANVAISAMLNGVDKDGNPISKDDYNFLSTITGWD